MRRSLSRRALRRDRDRRGDAFLAERAGAAGADFRDGLRVTDVAADERGASVRVDGRWLRAEARQLRRHLAKLCCEHGIPVERLERVCGYRLPIASRGAPLARGRALVAGDAAGLVDPLTGDGIYEAFMSATLAAEETVELPAGRARDLERYNVRVRSALGRELSTAWAAKVALEGFPRLMFTVARAEVVQRGLERLARSEVKAHGGLSRAPAKGLGMLARAFGDAGHAIATR